MFEKGHRFECAFEAAFPEGLMQIGETRPDTEYQSQEDRQRGREVKQRVDEATGKRQWVCPVVDPSEEKAKRASFEVTFLADVQPVPTESEVVPGFRPIVLEGLMVEPKVMGQGEYRYQGYRYFATGIAGKQTPSANGKPASVKAGA